MPKLNPEQEQQALLAKVEAELAKAGDKRKALVATAALKAEKAAKAQAASEAAAQAVTDHDASVEILKKRAEWVRSMPTGAPVPADAEFGDAVTADDEDAVLV